MSAPLRIVSGHSQTRVSGQETDVSGQGGVRASVQKTGGGVRAAVDNGPTGGPSGEAFRQYFGRLVKMIPGEVMGFYAMGASIITEESPTGLLIWSIISLIGLVVLRAMATRDPANNLGPQWIAIGFSALAFILWLYTIGGPFKAYGIHDPKIGSLAVLCWGFFVPLFYRGDE